MLKESIDWEKIMPQSRCAGGHVGIMENLFKDAKVVAYYVQNDYQGSELFLYRFNKNKWVLVSDYFGSCSGCDAYEDCTDEQLRNLCIELANNANVFNSIKDVVRFLKEDVHKDAVYFKYRENAEPLLKELQKSRLLKLKHLEELD